MLKYSKMGNVIGVWMNNTAVLEETGAMVNSVTLWDMICHLTKQYIFTKLEQDEFLREYLVGNATGVNFLTMGQRAIKFEPEPLPSRIMYNRKQKGVQDYERVTRETIPRHHVRFDEVDDEEVIYVEEMSSSSESEEEIYENFLNEIPLYSAYEAILGKLT